MTNIGFGLNLPNGDQVIHQYKSNRCANNFRTVVFDLNFSGFVVHLGCYWLELGQLAACNETTHLGILVLIGEFAR